jgi:hypothetical protein
MCPSASFMFSSVEKCRFPTTLACSCGVSSKSAERSRVDDVATKLPTICWVDLVTFLTVDGAVFAKSGGGAATTVSGDAVGLFSLLLRLSFGLGVERNQPLIRDCTGEASGLGESEGNEVRLLVSSLGEGARLRLRLSDALDVRFDGRIRAMLRFLGLEKVEFWDAERTRSTDPGESMAAITVST